MYIIYALPRALSRRLVKWVRELAVSPGLMLTTHLQLLPEVNNAWIHTSDLPYFFLLVQHTVVDQGFLIYEVSRSHTTTHHSR